MLSFETTSLLESFISGYLFVLKIIKLAVGCSFHHDVIINCVVYSQVYRVADMELVRVLPSAEDEVNVACFHPRVGGGLVYGTKVCPLANPNWHTCFFLGMSLVSLFL